MDQLTEMKAFAAVVDRGGFTDAAGELGLSKSAVSKQVSALEERLGVRLLDRTTRIVVPTEIGAEYYERVRHLLSQVQDADAHVSEMQSAPSGLLRISVATDFGVTKLAPLLPGFMDQFPEISVNMVLGNRYVELISEGFDVAVRIGDLPDSSLRARKLTDVTKRMIAAPSYVQKHGRPHSIDDLLAHKLLQYSNQTGGNIWKLITPSGGQRQLRTSGPLSVNDGQSLLQACIKGLGIAYLPSYLYADALEQGLVEEVIPSLPVVVEGVYVVYPAGRFTHPKVRAFIDYMAEAFAHKVKAQRVLSSV